MKSREDQLEDFKKIAELAHSEDCKKCYGRGYQGWDSNLEMFIPCECVWKAERKIIRERLAQQKVSVN